MRSQVLVCFIFYALTSSAAGFRLTNHKKQRKAASSKLESSSLSNLKLAQVLIFGDSWTRFYTPTWPELVGSKLDVPVKNFGRGGTWSGHLKQQVRNALRAPVSDGALAIIHSGGNDQMGTFVTNPRAVFEELAAPGMTSVTKNILGSLDQLYAGGVRSFVVSDIPASSQFKPIREQVELIHPMLPAFPEIMLSLQVKPGDSVDYICQRLNLKYHEKMALMIDHFTKDKVDVSVLHWNEGEVLGIIEEDMGSDRFNSIGRDTNSFWSDKIHPNAYGHEQLADRAYDCVAGELSLGSTVCPHRRMSA